MFVRRGTNIHQKTPVGERETTETGVKVVIVGPAIGGEWNAGVLTLELKNRSAFALLDGENDTQINIGKVTNAHTQKRNRYSTRRAREGACVVENLDYLVWIFIIAIMG